MDDFPAGPSPVEYEPLDVSYDPFDMQYMSGQAVWNTSSEETATHRYKLAREWNDAVANDLGLSGRLLFVMLNPSTATAETFDPTVRRCAGFCLTWGFRTLLVANLFAYRATDPQDMRDADDPIGERNDAAIQHLDAHADLTVCAWGNHGQYLRRGDDVVQMIHKPHALTITGAGQPGHPLYLPSDTLPYPLL